MFTFNGIPTYHRQLRQGQTSCTEAVGHYLQQMELHRGLNALVDIYAQEALARAAALDAERAQGAPLQPLHGVVVVLKDVLCYQGHRVSAASRILEGFESVYTATAVQRLLDAGAIIIGNANCDEFAMGSTNENSYYGPVLNAADTTRVPGGSSGGSAVAVQAGLCMASLGSDTGGSVRQPADFCGVIGLKPTYGRISRYGLIAYASSFDQIGIFSQTIEDAALLLEVMAGPDGYDSTALQEVPAPYSQSLAPQKTYRIAYWEEALVHPSLDKDIAAAIRDTLERLRQAGHTVEPVEMKLLDYVVPAYYVLTTAEASSNLNRYDGVRFGHRTEEPVENLTEFYERSRTEGFGKEVQRRIMLGTFVLSAGYYDAYYTRAQQVRRLLVDRTALIFNEFDAILLPNSPTTALPLAAKNDDPTAMYLADIYTVFANLTGLPGIALPLYRHPNGLPFGLQVMTKAANELTLLQLSGLLMGLYGKV
jgi:aspartyl-tRNA(Asn)/glutamyl-tRNA(Gln) amidotransferase subunit A